MEIEGADGSNIQIKPGQTRELGRAHDLNSSDKTISRRHVSFSVPAFSDNQEIRLQFEVLGRNPIYVNKNNEVKIFRRFGSGGQSVRQNDLESELAGNLESGSGLRGVEDLQQESVDISDIDPVKEFGLVVIGHEFDSYPKKMIRDIKNWDWFLEEAAKDCDMDNDEEKERGSTRSKRKKGIENEDEEWTGESEDDKVFISKSKKPQRPKYMTRSNERGKLTSKSKSKSTAGKVIQEVDDEDGEDEDEDDETLGGFIVDDENMGEEEEAGDEDEEEEEEEELADEYDEDE
ncbi:hypothetical protein Salat_2791400 [Sesamum alatum]|uniref:FHA domain-containing protein n=1 Tax=Sesamum alatum TaxID=300844 RepID=A0AAE1XL08_9LAMI|nr:hypothetical protein Salat_2791400 [Sesamum alatum]